MEYNNGYLYYYNNKLFISINNILESQSKTNMHLIILSEIIFLVIAFFLTAIDNLLKYHEIPIILLLLCLVGGVRESGNIRIQDIFF